MDIRVHPDGYVIRFMEEGGEETLERAQRCIARIRELAGARAPLPVLVVMGGLKSMTPDARTYYATHPDPHATATMLALVVNSPVSRVLGNVFLGISKPSIPAKLFATQEDAAAWFKSAPG